jgi:hypothetical protein
MDLMVGLAPLEKKTFRPLLGIERLSLGLNLRYPVTIRTTLPRFADVVGPHPFFKKGAPKSGWWRYNEDVSGGEICTIRT